MTLYFETQGMGPEIVLLHGWGMNLAVWSSLCAVLNSDYRMTLVELPGHGASPVSADAGVMDWAAECLAVAPPRAHWIGWSLGGQVALGAALSAPKRVTGLSLIAATPRFVRDADWQCATPAETFQAFAAALDDDPDATLQRFLALQVKGDEHARVALRGLRDGLRRRAPASPEGLRQGLRVLSQTDLRSCLRDVACPQHWLLGERDTLVPIAIRDWLGRQRPPTRVDVVAGAGHAPLMSHLDRCLPLLTEAIDGHG